MSAPTEPVRVDFPSGEQTIAAYRWDPDAGLRAVVQITHGMGEHALRYAGLAQRLNGRGMVVYAQDHRGHGATARSQDDLGQIGEQGWAELVQDIDRLSARARQEHPAVPLVLLGHSMGSFAVQQHLLDHSRDVTAAVLTGTAVLDLLEPALNLDEPIDLTMFNAPFQPARTDYDWLSRDEVQVDNYVRDRDAASGSTRPRARPCSRPPAGWARHEIFNETNRDEVVDDLLTWLDHRLGP